MNSRLVFSVLASAVLVQAQAPNLPVINTPSSVVQCLPSLLTFSGGLPPYTLTAIPGGQVDAAPLADLGSQTGSSYTWNVNLQAGTAITLQIRDSKGVIGYSQAVTIQPNSDSSCLGSSASSKSPPSPTSPSPPAATGSSNSSPARTNSTSGGNTTSSSGAAGTNPGARSNSSLSATASNSTANRDPSASSSVNQTKSPSVFTPPTTSSVSNSNSASTNAPSSAAPATTTHYKGFAAALAVAGAALTMFA